MLKKNNNKINPYQGGFKKKNILIITFENRDLKLLPYHNLSFLNYAHKYNYSYLFLNEYKSDLPIYWWKIQILIDYLENKNFNFDYIVWSDSDIIIDIDLPLEYLIRLTKKKILMSIEKNNVYNAGFFMIKKSKIGLQFLKECISYYKSSEFCKDENNNMILRGQWAGSCYEQGVMNILCINQYKKYVYGIPSFFVYNNNIFINNKVFIHNHNTNRKDLIAYYFKKLLESKRNFINLFNINKNVNYKKLLLINFKNINKYLNKLNNFNYIIIYFELENEIFNYKIDKKIFKFLPNNYLDLAILDYNENFIGLSNEEFKKFRLNNNFIKKNEIIKYIKYNLDIIYFY
jgi:hypothetical protein